MFLEKEELNRWQEFLQQSTLNPVFLANTKDWGIVDFQNDLLASYKIEVGTNAGTVKLSKASYAIDKNGALIYSPIFDNYAIPNDSAYYWLKIGYQTSALEVGTLSIDTVGNISGVGTAFTSVLRGSSAGTPTKIKFYKSGGAVNNQIYEVVSVTSDTAAILAGSFTAESNLSYVVLGTFVLGEALTGTQELGDYIYDSCLFTLVPEVSVDVPPALVDADLEFYTARIRNVGGTVTVTDKRTAWWTFSLRDALLAANNLDDVENVATTLTNLGVYSKAYIDAILIGWRGLEGATPTGLNGWTFPASFGYFRDPFGVVHMQGWIVGSSASGDAAGVLSIGFRPKTDIMVALVSDTETFTGASIHTDGTIYINQWAEHPMAIYFDSVTFIGADL
jgi:hypothetical protein